MKQFYKLEKSFEVDHIKYFKMYLKLSSDQIDLPSHVQKMAKCTAPLHILKFLFDCEAIVHFAILAD